MTIIGEILSFKHLLQRGLNAVLSERIPFLLNCVQDFEQTFRDDHVEQLVCFR